MPSNTLCHCPYAYQQKLYSLHIQNKFSIKLTSRSLFVKTSLSGNNIFSADVFIMYFKTVKLWIKNHATTKSNTTLQGHVMPPNQNPKKTAVAKRPTNRLELSICHKRLRRIQRHSLFRGLNFKLLPNHSIFVEAINRNCLNLIE